MGQYIEYDLAKMTDSYGGYLMIDQVDDAKMVRDLGLIEKNRKERMDVLKAQGLMYEPCE